MKLKTCGRILATPFVEESTKQRYWAARSQFALSAGLLRPANWKFTHHVAKDQIRFLLNRVHPVEGETRERAQAAAAWLMRAHDATGDGGVSLGYFPCEANGSRWRRSYPETTGYIIPSLLEYGEYSGEREPRDKAMKMAAWEMQVQMAMGAAQAGPVCPPNEQVPAAFNTGMVLHGYTAAYRASRNAQFISAGRRAADFLLTDLGEDGHFKSHGTCVTPHQVKTYNCLCAWALYRIGEDAGDDRYIRAAIRVVEAALEQQQANGWFANNCLSNPKAPLLHTIGYTLQGILEVGILMGRGDFIEAVQRGTDPLLARISRQGFLHGRFYSDWEPAVFSSCLTGSAQLAMVCYRLHIQTGDLRYRTAADRLVNYLKALQVLESDNPGIHGALSGSFPVMGSYMTAGYPNWATKYLLDALLLQARLRDS